MAEKFRVQDKGKKTSFKLFERKPGSDAFVFAGQFFAPGFDRTDEQCVASALDQIDEDAQSGK